VRHLYTCQLRRADLHGDGTVGNVLVVDYLQEARLDLLRHHDTSPTPSPGEGLVVVRTVVDYVRPIRLSDAPLVVDTWVCELRAASFTVAYELRTEVGVHARATTVLTPFVFATGRPRRLTPDELARLETTSGEPPFADGRRERPAAWSEEAYRRPIQVRFSDVDLLGHVNNVRYFDYVHEAQVEVMTGVFQEARISGTVDMVVARSEMDHIGQMNVRPEPYDVWSRVAAVGRTSVTFESEIRDGGRAMARSRVVEVNVDDDGRPLAHHPRHLELFEQRIG
jgi:acyl-CoA thioester hydrolase